MLVRKSEDRHQQPAMVFVIEQFSPVLAAQFHPAREALRPIIRMRNTGIILQKKRHERFTRIERARQVVPVPHDEAEELLHFGLVPPVFPPKTSSIFTGTAFTGLLAASDIGISMDGKGAWRDNVFVKRLWRSVKYEEVYLHAYDSVSAAREGIGRYLAGC